jgi:hypothetical protein
MAGVRVILAVLIALSLGRGPEAGAPCSKPAPQHAPAVMADMEECEHANGAALSDRDFTPSDGAACTLECCMLKCFKRFVDAPRVEPAAMPVTVTYTATNIDTPATPHYTPQPPPPRS